MKNLKEYGSWIYDTVMYNGLEGCEFNDSRCIDSVLMRSIKAKGELSEEELMNPQLYLSNLQAYIQTHWDDLQASH